MVENVKRRMWKGLSTVLAVVIFLTGLTSGVTASAVKVDDFADVAQNAWYHSAVQHVVERNYFTGISDTAFAPNQGMNRAMAVTVLARMFGGDLKGYTGKTPFTDVPIDGYYAKAVQWAVDKGITNGTSSTTFSPNSVVTREQINTFLYNAVKATGKLDDFDSSVFDTFDDKGDVASWAADAMKWATSKGVMNGSNGFLKPKTSTTRAAFATIIMNYDKKAPAGEAGTCTHKNTVELPGREANCTQTGLSAGSKCADCGKIIIAQKETPALGHSYVNGVCTRCGGRETTQDDNYVFPEILITADSSDYSLSWGDNRIKTMLKQMPRSISFDMKEKELSIKAPNQKMFFDETSENGKSYGAIYRVRSTPEIWISPGGLKSDFTILIHETGHFVFDQGPSHDQLESDMERLYATRCEFDGMKIATGDTYYQHNVYEYFAEAFRVYFSGEKFKTECPILYSYLDQYITAAYPDTLTKAPETIDIPSFFQTTVTLESIGNPSENENRLVHDVDALIQDAWVNGCDAGLLMDTHQPLYDEDIAQAARLYATNKVADAETALHLASFNRSDTQKVRAYVDSGKSANTVAEMLLKNDWLLSPGSGHFRYGIGAYTRDDGMYNVAVIMCYYPYEDE